VSDRTPAKTEPGKKPYRVAVVGAGPGGYAAAFRAADLGLDVTLIDPEAAPGGVCLYRGCIPSKAYLHVAKVLEEAESARRWGIAFDKPEIDVDRVRAWKDEVVTQLTGGLASLAKARAVRHVRGRASFAEPGRLVVEGATPGRETVEFDYAIVATGSRPTVPEPLTLDSPRVMTSTGALALPDVPATLLVVGGGYIGLELGSVYAALGSRVTVVEMTESLLPGVDKDLVRPLTAAIEKRLEAIHLGTAVRGLKETRGGIEVSLQSKDDTGARTETYEKVLVAVGRRPNSSGLGLENTSAEIDERGFVIVDAERRTRDDRIFAVGDVAGQPMLAHKATHEGLVAAGVIAGANDRFEPRCVPAVVFTDPEIAWCGLTEIDARSAETKVDVARFPWQASGRALTLGRDSGVTKIISDPETGRVLGVGICGSSAGDLIGEAALAIEMGANVEDLASTIHPHPTLSETLMEAAEVARGLGIHMKKKR
jgi:dihydrolipoamide dehydrogenase